ncbi:lipid A deacylase LpxR family protein [Pseudocnuella soli]|uniref:lipid A deacylase LpxR family protein n=1 Tax=Pseudocnuella soli TaxID=2502779 RepID=UPI0014042CDB|nr:lipid A deacylase LpxR family protein [Pseudocnuella soli]
MSHQVTLVSENDNYAFTFRDRYYSNGTMLRYVHALPPGANGQPRLFTAELGHQIFTPYRFNTGDAEDMDRPFTGYLYVKALHSRFYAGGGLLQWGAQIGVVGEKAFGKEVQRWHHHNFRLRVPLGWENQLKTAVGINAEARYVHPLLQVGNPSFGMQLHGSVQGQFGNLFVQGGTGALLRMGRFNKASGSAAFDARMLDAGKRCEWYVYYEPQLIAQAHNATLQGGWMQHADNRFATSPRPLLARHQAGMVVAPRRFSIQVAMTHKGREATTMHLPENWGTAALSFRW